MKTLLPILFVIASLGITAATISYTQAPSVQDRIAELALLPTSGDLAGHWYLSDTHIEASDEFPDVEPLRPETCLWQDLHKDATSPLLLTVDNRMEFQKYDKLVQGAYEVEGNTIKLIFFGRGSKWSYIPFEYTLKDNQLTISREDAMASETYTFIKQ